MAQATLTDEQRETLNAAEALLRDLLIGEEVLMLSLHSGWETISVSYFSPTRVQYTSLHNSGDRTLAGKIDQALVIRADEEANADKVKAKRIAALKAELSSLGEAA